MAKFNIEAHLHRYEGRSKVRTVVWIRRYARIATAIRRCSEFLVEEGAVGDLIEFTLRINGYQCGTIRLTAKGTMETLWNDKVPNKLKNKKLVEKPVVTKGELRRSETLQLH